MNNHIKIRKKILIKNLFEYESFNDLLRKKDFQITTVSGIDISCLSNIFRFKNINLFLKINNNVLKNDKNKYNLVFNIYLNTDFIKTYINRDLKLKKAFDKLEQDYLNHKSVEYRNKKNIFLHYVCYLMLINSFSNLINYLDKLKSKTSIFSNLYKYKFYENNTSSIFENYQFSKVVLVKEISLLRLNFLIKKYKRIKLISNE